MQLVKVHDQTGSGNEQEGPQKVDTDYLHFTAVDKILVLVNICTSPVASTDYCGNGRNPRLRLFYFSPYRETVFYACKHDSMVCGYRIGRKQMA